MTRGAAQAFYEQSINHQGDACLRWPHGRDAQGYAVIRRGKTMRRVGVIHCERIFGPKPSPAHEAAHNCGRGMYACAHPGHLKGWVTRVENEADKANHGTRRSRTLSWEIVEALREAANHLPLEFLAATVGITRYSVWRAVRHKSWRLDNITG
jgi:hypothetical protein